ncbi:hypothetical protein [Hoyosella altamirensis]|uniref:Uncharacterized protein n=1 Tax=Hoyosella altamirensis TaxID=616997 RepID=A0A839RK65_9ACTN|nr:hypothetical protein [Hoyosella altamirensis]MBB3037242.1 hypothetical protein [Hoyosella altamirensis]
MSAASKNSATNVAVWMLLVSGVALAALVAVADLILFAMVIGGSAGAAVGILAAVYYTGDEDGPFGETDEYGLAN